jgi:hypothetical protein
VQVACTINYGRKGLWKEIQNVSRVDYRVTVGENVYGSFLEFRTRGEFLSASGPVAQLGARFHGMEEVAGSIPARSTKFLSASPASLIITLWT